MTARRLDAFVRERHQVSWGKARAWIESGKVFVDGRVVVDPGFLPAETVAIELRMNAPRTRAGEGPVGLLLETRAAHPALPEKIEVVHLDSQLVVVNKPAGISTVPFERAERGTLEQRVSEQLGGARLRVVQRLDRETSGLLVFARTREAEARLANQFRFHSVHRRYLALAHGEVRDQTLRSVLVENRGDGLRGSLPKGSGIQNNTARPAVTHVRALSRFQGMSLVECRLETGRTHQIRIHLSESGHPLVGEKAYIREYHGSRRVAPRLMLHASELGFVHPLHEQELRWRLPPPEDFLALLPGELRTAQLVLG